MTANGVTPEEMMRVVTNQGKPPFKDVHLGDLLRPNLLEFARKGAMLPLLALSQVRSLSRPARRDLADGHRDRVSPRGCRRGCTRAPGSRAT